MPIALDIGNNSIKMLQLSMSNVNGSVIAADEVRIDADTNKDSKARKDFIVKTIERMLDKGNFIGHNVISCLPDDKLKIMSLRLGQSEGMDIEDALKKEVSQRFGLDPAKDSINYGTRALAKTVISFATLKILKRVLNGLTIGLLASLPTRSGLTPRRQLRRNSYRFNLKAAYLRFWTRIIERIADCVTRATVFAAHDP